MPLLPKISTSNNWQQVYQVLKQSILQRKFGPNEKIAIPDLAEQLGVSPTPIRDALSRLEAEGLIRTVPKVGTFVVPVNEKHASNMIEARLMMEFWVLDKWTELEQDRRRRTIEGMAALVSKAESMLTPVLLEAYHQADLDREFHLELVRAGDNDRISDIYDTTMNYHVFNLAGGLFTPDKFRASWQQHGDIVDALAAGDVSRAKAAVKAHLDSSRRNLLYHLEQSGGQL